MMNERKEIGCMLLISGTGQNTGKTTLGAHIVNRLAASTEVYALKISPHFHEPGPDLPVLAWGKGFVVYEETNRDSGKDSSRYLQAGARKVFYVTAEKSSVGIAVKEVMKQVPACVPLVCESGELARFYKPGLHVLLKGKDTEKKPQSDPDLIVVFNGDHFLPGEDSFQWDGQKWFMRL